MIRVSILLPTFNRAVLLPRAIQSVIDQSFKDWELIVINDASTDTTAEMVEKWQRRESRIKLITNKQNLYPDISKTLNIGISAAQGGYIARLDDDDYWSDPEKLAKQVQYLDSHPECVLIGGGMIVVDQQDKELYRFLKPENDLVIRDHALLANPFAHTTVMYRATAVRQVGMYSNLRYAEDWDLWLKLGTVGKLHNLQVYLTKYLQAGQNKSLTHQRQHTRAIFGIIRSHRKNYPHATKAYLLNTLQYLYALLVPLSLRKLLHAPLSGVKRRL